ncbi:MAG: hypothetical protein RLP44_23585 [Aggregatilineales bacterium]
MMANEDNFLELVQAHERAWGTEDYPNRPGLAQFLSSPIVLWWKSIDPAETRLMATVHDDLDALNKYATRVLVHSRSTLPDRRLTSIFVNQKKSSVRSVTVNVIGVDE